VSLDRRKWPERVCPPAHLPTEPSLLSFHAATACPTCHRVMPAQAPSHSLFARPALQLEFFSTHAQNIERILNNVTHPGVSVKFSSGGTKVGRAAEVRTQQPQPPERKCPQIVFWRAWLGLPAGRQAGWVSGMVCAYCTTAGKGEVEGPLKELCSALWPACCPW
jgi:hypothetical protein